jgi:hypothetical protein
MVSKCLPFGEPQRALLWARALVTGQWSLRYNNTAVSFCGVHPTSGFRYNCSVRVVLAYYSSFSSLKCVYIYIYIYICVCVCVFRPHWTSSVHTDKRNDYGRQQCFWGVERGRRYTSPRPVTRIALLFICKWCSYLTGDIHTDLQGLLWG